MPWLYLSGISNEDIPTALEALVGKDDVGLSAIYVVQLKKQWQDDIATWFTSALSKIHFVYFGTDGVYPRIRLDNSNSQCKLVIMGATAKCEIFLTAIGDVLQETKPVGCSVLMDLKKRGLKVDQAADIGDGALEFWRAISKELPEAANQRCRAYKTWNILAKLPKSTHGKAKGLPKDMYSVGTRAHAKNYMDHFNKLFTPKHPQAANCLNEGRADLFTFYDYPAVVHWVHLGTTKPIESVFATIWPSTKHTKSRKAGLIRPFKPAQRAEKNENKLRDSQLMADVIDIKVKFVDGVRATAA